MNTFDKDKARYLEKLGKPDKSSKGGVDEAIWPLIDAMNAHDDYYTTSSCSGRTSLFADAEKGRKDLSFWHFVTHDETSLKEVQPYLETLPQESVWFKFESAILHVVARTEDRANELLQVARDCGFKHSGLLATKKRYVLELIDSERMDVPIAIEGNLIVDEKFIGFLIEKANKKLQATHERMEKLLIALE